MLHVRALSRRGSKERRMSASDIFVEDPVPAVGTSNVLRMEEQKCNGVCRMSIRADVQAD